MCRILLCKSEADFCLQHRITKLVASLQESLRKEPTYMLAELDVYSMQDLAEVKTGDLVTRLRELVSSSSQHVAGCQVCSNNLFV
jgi:hypothetical protein